jgi:tetratricopeptide (TPR) repeat protein
MHAGMAWCSLATRRGDFDRIPEVEAWYRGVQDSSPPEVWQINEWWIAYARAQAGDPAGALPALETITEEATAANASVAPPVVIRPRVAAWLGEAYLLAGRDKEATFMAAQAIDLARAWGQDGFEAWAHRLEGEIAARRSPPDVADAVASYGRALALARPAGMRPLEAHCRLGLGRLYALIGRSGEARSELAAAVALLRMLGMTRWHDEAEAILARLGSGP